MPIERINMILDICLSLNLDQDYIKMTLFKYVDNYQILHNEKS